MRILPDSVIIRKNISENLNLTCVVDSLPSFNPVWSVRKSLTNTDNLDEEVNFFFSEPHKSTRTVASSSYFIPILSRSNDGFYSCCVENNSNLCKTIQVIVQDKPSRPKILSATFYTKSNELDINWSLQDFGGASLNKILIEWTDKQNQTHNTGNYTY